MFSCFNSHVLIASKLGPAVAMAALSKKRQGGQPHQAQQGRQEPGFEGSWESCRNRCGQRLPGVTWVLWWEGKRDDLCMEIIVAVCTYKNKIHIHLFVHVNVHIYIYIYVYIHIYIYKCIHIYVYV